MSQYLILIYDDEAAWESAPPETSGQIHQGHSTFAEKNGAALAGGN
ncbi:MAG: hypothetical protein QOH89_3068, partial [Pseudonocardiales bacterium]|nr:hypothetical protein [Pseudonocardiales bacterium]